MTPRSTSRSPSPLVAAPSPTGTTVQQDTISFDWQDAYVTDASHNILATIMHVC